LFFTLRLRERISATRWSDVFGTPPDIWRCPKASPSRRQSSGVNLELIVLCQKLVATLQGQQKPLNSVSGGVADHESSADFFSVINDLNAHLCRRVYGCSPCQRSSLVAGTAFPPVLIKFVEVFATHAHASATPSSPAKTVSSEAIWAISRPSPWL
jgi:hypothetical protein